jgi:DNA modification methylase
MSYDSYSPELSWTTETRKVKDLIPLEINPRKISGERLEKLAHVINKFNVVEIPAIDVDNTLLTFHQRLKALLLLGRGDEMIDVRVPNRKLTEKEAKEYNLIANTHAGEFDVDVFDENFADIDLEAIGLSKSDIDINLKIDELLRMPKEKKEAVDDGYVIPEQIETEIVEGDLIEIGPHRLFCGDGRNSEAWKILCDGRIIDLMLIDPPYNVDYTGKTRDELKIMNDSMPSAAYYEFLLQYFTVSTEFLKEGGIWYIWHADSEGHTVRNAFLKAGNKLSQNLIWKKDSMVMGRQDYHWQHEPCLYGWKPGAGHHWYSDRTQTTILEFDRPSRNDKHPTMKPIPLFSYLLNNSSKEGQIIADSFVGSGTTMATCHQLGRTCLAMELDPRFCQVTVDRMAQLDPELIIYHNGHRMRPASALA